MLDRVPTENICSVAASAEQLALRDAVHACAERTTPIAAVRAADPAALRACWAALAEVGVFGVALPAELGGAGGTVPDAAAALEQAAAELLPGPVLPTVLAGLLLARCPDAAVAKELLPGLAEGALPIAVGLEPGTLRAEGDPDRPTVSGEVGAVLGAGPEATALLLGAVDPDGGEVWFVIDADHPGVTVTGRPSVDLSRSLARVTLRDVALPPGRLLPGLTGAAVRDLAVTLAAAEATGIADRCLRTATEHARVREQFGRPIGSFQAVKHLCVAMLCRAEQAAAVSWDAARAAEQAPAELPLAASAAAALALDAAVDNAKDAIQVLGGIGFSWEHDAHLYLRRALALRQLLGSSAGWRTRLASLAVGGARRTLGVRLGPETAGERAELIASIKGVDYVTVFDERSPARLLGVLEPDFQAKGTDYTADSVPEAEVVKSYGGRIIIVGDPKDHSTTEILKRMKAEG